MIKYSIIVPTMNNCENYLKPCLEAVFKYTDLSDKEIIVVANGCTDGTRQYVSSLGDKIKLIWMKDSAGQIIPVNEGVKAALGEYVVLLDNDSHLLEQPVNKWIEILSAPFSDSKTGMSGVFVTEYPYLGKAIHSGCSMYRKEVWEKVGGGDEAFGFGYLYDTDLSLRIKEAGFNIVGVGTDNTFPLYHPGSPVTSERKQEDVALIRKNRNLLYERHGKKPRYSIIVPTYNHLEDCLMPCLNSIVQHTNLEDVEVIVVANGCKDKTAEFVDSLGHPFKLVWFDDGLGFTKATNEGIKLAFGEYIILLNNDTILLEKGLLKNTWIDMMVSPFLKDDKVGITGPLELYDRYADAKVMIFFCVMIRKKLFDEIGLLDESYSPGGGEDIDFCVKAQQVGYKEVVVPDNDLTFTFTNEGRFPIYHLGEGTFSEKEWPEYGRKIIKDNGLKNMIRYNKHIKLNVGSGGVEVPGYISVDKYDTRANILMDVFDLELSENSVEEILASHLFEHVNPYNSVDLLKKWLKVLKPGGKLIMEMPNIEELCKLFVTSDKSTRYGILNCIYGTVNTKEDGKPSEITSPHLWGWYPEMLFEHLVWAGYTEIAMGAEQIPHPFKNFRVEAVKPLVFRDYIDEFIYTNTLPGDSVLDLGCGDKSRTKLLTRNNKVVSVDAWEKTKPDILLDVEKSNLPFAENSFDVVLLIDFVEHLDKEIGKKVIDQAIKIAKKKVILLTPNFWTDNMENVNNPDLWCYHNEFDKHKSEWKAEDFTGWEVIAHNKLLADKFIFRVWNKK